MDTPRENKPGTRSRRRTPTEPRKEGTAQRADRPDAERPAGSEPYVPDQGERESALPPGYQSSTDPAIRVTNQPAGLSQPGLSGRDQDVAFDHQDPEGSTQHAESGRGDREENRDTDDDDEFVREAREAGQGRHPGAGNAPEERGHSRTERDPAEGGDVGPGRGASRPTIREGSGPEQRRSQER
jgi:hypothetical protein